MNTPRPATDDTLTVLYDGGCPLCRREIAHVQGLAERQGGTALCFVDISQTADPALQAEQQRLLARFHVQKADGSRLQGAAAFAAMWDRLPGWRWLARMSRWPGMLWLLERAYNGFLKVRPALQSLARRLEFLQPPGQPSSIDDPVLQFPVWDSQSGAATIRKIT